MNCAKNVNDRLSDGEGDRWNRPRKVAKMKGLGSLKAIRGTKIDEHKLAGRKFFQV